MPHSSRQRQHRQLGRQWSCPQLCSLLTIAHALTGNEVVTHGRLCCRRRASGQRQAQGAVAAKLPRTVTSFLGEKDRRERRVGMERDRHRYWRPYHRGDADPFIKTEISPVSPRVPRPSRVAILEVDPARVLDPGSLATTSRQLSYLLITLMAMALIRR